MTLLIDTHTFLWFVNDDPQLSETAALVESDTTILLSIASLWEITIKVSIGKLTLPQPFTEFIPDQLTLNDITLLPIRITDCTHVIDLPFHHRDPFDWMIIAQALVESMPVVRLGLWRSAPHSTCRRDCTIALTVLGHAHQRQ